MSADGSRGFWVTNHLANPVLRPLLRSRAGARLGRKLAVIRYRGRRTGTEHELIVQYARHDDRVWVMPGQADRKTWWRNLRQPAGVDVWLAGRRRHGTAVAIDGRRHPAEVAEGLRQYLAELPRARKAIGAEGQTDLTTIAPTAVMVRIDLDR